MPSSGQITATNIQFFYRTMPFLSRNEQCQKHKHTAREVNSAPPSSTTTTIIIFIGY